MTIPLNQIPNEPTLKDLLDQFRRDLLLSLFCHHLGTVQSFDASKQTATATINYKKTYYEFDSSTQLYKPVLVDYPLLVDCPVVCLGGGPASLTFPIQQGDECLVMFNDRDLDNWFQGGSGGSVATPRLHSFSDGIILVGIRSMANVLDSVDLTRAVLQYGTTLVGVGTSKIKISNATTTLNTQIQLLITQLTSLTAQLAALTVTGVTGGGGTSGVPSNAALITAIGNSINTIGSNLGGLLE